MNDERAENNGERRTDTKSQKQSGTDGDTLREFDTQPQQETKTMQRQNGKATNPGWAVQIDGVGGRDEGGQWACGSCPALDLRMLAHPVLLLAK